MITVDFGGAGVVVTGGTRGLGKAIGIEFARGGAAVTLTHRWGSVPEEALRAEFQGLGLAPPHVVESDASEPDAARDLMRQVRARTGRLLAVVSNVAFTRPIRDLEELKRGSLELTLRYSTWPVLDLLQAAREAFGTYPRYVVAVSTDGGEVCHPGYDMAGVAKAALETLCRYLAVRLRPEGVRVNAVRPGFVDTESARAVFGDAVLERPVPGRDDLMIDAHTVGRACVALCSGWMDGVSGQVIHVDEGASLISPITYLTGLGWPGPMHRWNAGDEETPT